MMIIRGLQIAFGVAAAVLVPPYGYVIAAVLIPYAVWMLIKEARKPYPASLNSPPAAPDPSRSSSR